MNSNFTFFFNVLILVMCGYSVWYLVYGRITRKALIGNYGPGKPYHKEFLKIVDNNLYLFVSIIATLLTVASLVFSLLQVLPQSDHSILFVAPIMTLVLFFVIFKMISSTYKEKS